MSCYLKWVLSFVIGEEFPWGVSKILQVQILGMTDSIDSFNPDFLGCLLFVNQS